jgi:hypothetical protein
MWGELDRQRNVLGEAQSSGDARESNATLVVDRHIGLVGDGALDVVYGAEWSEMDRSEATRPKGATGGEHQM